MRRGLSTAAIAYAFAVTMIGTTLPTPLYPIYQQKIRFSALIVTVVFAVYGLGVLAALLLFGQLSDRYGRRALLLPGLGLAAASSIVFLLAQGLPALFVGRALSGLSAGIFTGTATAALLDVAAPDRRARATLIATVANIGGLGIGALLSGVLAELAPAPLRTPYWVHLAMVLLALPAIWAIPEPIGQPPGGGFQLTRLSVPAEVRGTFVRAGTAAFAAFATMGLFTGVAPAFLDKLLSLPNHALTGAVVFLVFAASTGGQIVEGRFASERALPSGCAVMIAGMAFIAGALAASSLALLVIGAVVAGLGTGLSFRAGIALLGAQTPAEHRGEVNSSFFAVAYLALSVPIIGVGVASEAIGLRAAGLVFSGFVALLALAVLLSLTRAVSSSRSEQPPGRLHTAATADPRDSR